MADSNTRKLLFILAGAIVIAAGGIAFDLGLERLSSAKAGIALREGQIRRLQRSLPGLEQIVQQRDTLKKEVEQRSARFYTKDETDPYAFGAVVRNKLVSFGLSVLRYQVIDVKGSSYLEFSVTGSARAFLLFLRDVSQAPKLWVIPSLTLSVREGSGTVDVDFRIGYAIGDA